MLFQANLLVTIEENKIKHNKIKEHNKDLR